MKQKEIQIFLCIHELIKHSASHSETKAHSSCALHTGMYYKEFCSKVIRTTIMCWLLKQNKAKKRKTINKLKKKRFICTSCLVTRMTLRHESKIVYRWELFCLQGGKNQRRLLTVPQEHFKQCQFSKKGRKRDPYCEPYQQIFSKKTTKYLLCNMKAEHIILHIWK